MAQRFLEPDQKIFSEIFPTSPPMPRAAWITMDNTENSCTIHLRLRKPPRPEFPLHLAVQLESTGGRLLLGAGLQRLARHQLGDLVPEVLATGTTTNSEGRELAYMVTPAIDKVSRLAWLWPLLRKENQQSIMTSVFQAVKALHELDPQSDAARPLIAQLGAGNEMLPMNGDDSNRVNSVAIVKQLLERLSSDSKGNNNCSKIVSTADGGIEIRSHTTSGNDSESEGEYKIKLTDSDLDALQRNVVFCHNLLVPKNIIVKPVETGDPDRPTRYDLAAITGWDTAGFYPFAYEIGVADALLGTQATPAFGWYTQFRECALALLPEGEAHTKLIRAMNIITRFKARTWQTDPIVRAQEEWLEEEKLTLSNDVKLGWTRWVSESDSDSE
jgi:hypothetical protein